MFIRTIKFKVSLIIILHIPRLFSFSLKIFIQNRVFFNKSSCYYFIDINFEPTFLDPFDLAVVGGGAAAFMTAVTAAENGVKRIIILEGSSKLMEKVRISGGGRCNVTNASWIPNELVENYPRGGIKLLESFNRFAAGDVFDWFEKRGLNLKIESDNRVFPISDSSLDVISCLKKNAMTKGVEISTKFFVIIESFSLSKIVKRLSEVFKISLTENLVNISTPLFIAFFFKQLITSKDELDTGNTLLSASIFKFNPLFSNQSNRSPAAKRLNDSKSLIPPRG